jgi:hypothetical protein
MRIRWNREQAKAYMRIRWNREGGKTCMRIRWNKKDFYVNENQMEQRGR